MKRYAVVTGASSGIGMEFARQLAKKGYSLVLTARREERLKELAKELSVECKIILADLSKEEECRRLFEEIKDLKIAVFINNAGFGNCGKFTDSSLEKELTMIRVNIEAMHILMKLVLQKMQTENIGYILNVASSAGLLPAGPYMSAYYATKAYVTSLTRGVAEELREAGSRVYIGCLCPGPVDTEFNSVANVEFALKGIRAKDCVAYALQQMARRQTVIVPTLLMKLATTSGRIVPQKLCTQLVARQQKKKMEE